MITPDDIRNPASVTGFDHVNRMEKKATRYRGQAYGGKDTKAGHSWYGPSRKTALEAAQDYCDHVNQKGIVVRANLKTAGHSQPPQRSQHPKRIEANRLLREAAADESGDTAGYVYCVGETGTRYAVKIGKSRTHPRYRLNGLQTGNPRKLKLLGFTKVPNRHEAETALHVKYAGLNLLGEWFRLTPEVLSEFAKEGEA